MLGFLANGLSATLPIMVSLLRLFSAVVRNRSHRRKLYHNPQLKQAGSRAKFYRNTMVPATTKLLPVIRLLVKPPLDSYWMDQRKISKAKSCKKHISSSFLAWKESITCTGYQFRCYCYFTLKSKSLLSVSDLLLNRKSNDVIEVHYLEFS